MNINNQQPTILLKIQDDIDIQRAINILTGNENIQQGTTLQF
jgi:hypothetical protein